MASGERKLIVEITSARALMPKDGEGSSNAYCVLDYDNNRKRTRVIPKSLDPTWNEKFEFPILDPSMPGDLEINVQNERRSGTGRRSSFLGKVVIPVILASNVPTDLRWYPLQKRGLFSNIKGDLG
jgi:Ca2+-dependent lipid-binding protein